MKKKKNSSVYYTVVFNGTIVCTLANLDLYKIKTFSHFFFFLTLKIFFFLFKIDCLFLELKLISFGGDLKGIKIYMLTCRKCI